jgi:hypothetical protein
VDILCFMFVISHMNRIYDVPFDSVIDSTRFLNLSKFQIAHDGHTTGP